MGGIYAYLSIECSSNKRSLKCSRFYCVKPTTSWLSRLLSPFPLGLFAGWFGLLCLPAEALGTALVHTLNAALDLVKL